MTISKTPTIPVLIRKILVPIRKVLGLPDWTVHEFEEWCDNVSALQDGSKWELDNSLLGKDRDKWPATAQEIIRTKIIENSDSGRPVNIELIYNWTSKDRLIIDFHEIEKECSNNVCCHVLRIDCKGTPVVLRKGKLGAVISGSNDLCIEDCKVAEIKLNSGGIEIVGSSVGTLDLAGGFTSRKFTIEKSRIQKITAFDPKHHRNFRGTVEFRNAKFETSKKKSKLFQGPQSFRDLRIWLEELENSSAANVMRIHELRAERPNDPYLTRFIGWCYDNAANYGTSTTKPVLILLGLWFLATLLVWYFDGGSTPLPEEQYTGWRAILTDYGGGQWARSIYLVIQSTFDPLGIIGPRRLVVAATGAAHLWLMLHGIVTLGLVLMTAFGIRKRFKLH